MNWELLLNTLQFRIARVHAAMNKLIATIAGCEIWQLEDNSVTYIAPGRVDDDGSPNAAKDPDWQPGTSLHHNGEMIDADKVPYVVVPPAIIDGVRGIVLGCHAIVSDPATGKSTVAVVADVGPHHKLGEISMECCRRLGINPSPINGGEDAAILHYLLRPGVPALVDDITYELQRSL